MPKFTFEVAKLGEAATFSETLLLPGLKAAWCHLERLAFSLQDIGDEEFIQVRDADGHLVILTGLATARATQKKCGWPGCPLKGVRD